MTDPIALIKSFNLGFILSQPPFNSQSQVQISQVLSFAQVKGVAIREGIYTPNNDYEWLWQNIPALEAPNFIFVQCPCPINLSITAQGRLIVNAVPVNKMFTLLLPPGSLNVDNIYIEGRPEQAGASPMAQGVAAPYYCLMAQAIF